MYVCIASVFFCVAHRSSSFCLDQVINRARNLFPPTNTLGLSSIPAQDVEKLLAEKNITNNFVFPDFVCVG